jgi:RNA polymerase sigma factor (sigma-70 family)
MSVRDYHFRDNWSVVGNLPTPLQQFKKTHTAEEYEALKSFYYTEKWQKVEREHLGSDRRYYEKRKDWFREVDDPSLVCRSKYMDFSKCQQAAERNLMPNFEDRFENELLAECVKQLPPKQYEVIKLFVKGLTTAEIAARLRTTANNVSKLKKRAFNSIRTRYLQQQEKNI